MRESLHTLLAGTSVFTTLFAAITLLSPIFTPGSTVVFAPIQTLRPIFIGAQIVSLGRLLGVSGCVTVVNTTLGPMAELHPISIVFASRKTQFALMKTFLSIIILPFSK